MIITKQSNGMYLAVYKQPHNGYKLSVTGWTAWQAIVNLYSLIVGPF